MNVVISPNLKKTSDRIDNGGNIIDKRTHQILQANDPGYIPSREEREKLVNLPVSSALEQPKPIVPETVNDTPLSIQKDIESAEAKVVELKAKKAKLVEKMKAELKMLEGS